MCLVKLTCHIVGCSEQVDDPTAPQTRMNVRLLAGFNYLFCLSPIFDCQPASPFGKEPISDFSIYTCWTLHTPETISMPRHNLVTKTKKKRKTKMRNLWTKDAEKLPAMKVKSIQWPCVTCARCGALMDAMGLQILFTDARSKVAHVEPNMWCLSSILEDRKRVKQSRFIETSPKKLHFPA